MPVKVSYPGVYIEEIPSGQHVITGVATSITAFVGRAVCGPIDEPITIFNYGDYERMFGGLSYHYPMSYAVRDFFLNGGGQAIIARLYQEKTEPSVVAWKTKAKAAAGTVVTAVKNMKIVAATPAVGKTQAAPGTTPMDVVTTAKKAAAAFHAEPEHSAANAVVMVAYNAVGKPGATAAGVKSAVTAYDVTQAVPPYPTPTATLNLSRLTWAGVLSAAHSVIKASLDSLYAKDNVSVADPAPDPTSVSRAVKQRLQVLSNVSDDMVKKYARGVLISLGDPGENVYKALTTFMGNVVDGIKNAIPAEAASGLESAGDTYKNDVTTRVVNPLMENTGTLKLRKDSQEFAVSEDLSNAVLSNCFTAFAKPALVSKADTLNLVAANPGSWGRQLSATVDYNGITAESAQAYAKYGLGVNDLFNLSVEYVKPDGGKMVEQFPSVSIKKDTKSPNRLDRVLAHESQLIRVPMKDTGGVLSPLLPDNRPPENAHCPAGGGNDGDMLDPLHYIGDEDEKTGIYMLEKVDLFNLLCIPPDNRNGGDTDPMVYTEALAMCVKRRAMLIADPPKAWADKARKGQLSDISPTDPELGINGVDARNAAVYFPRVVQEDLEMNGQLDVFPASGIVAGVMAATDVRRGVWKAPAGQDAGLMGIQALEVKLADDENGILNPVGINCLRNFPIIGPVVWGARTLRGADQLADDYKYVPVRRLTLYVEESLYRGTKWAVFEPNDESLWSALRLSVGTFLSDLQRQGAFYTYKVVCDATTTTQSDIDKGIVNILVQIAPVKPAEFVVIKIQQIAGRKAA